jgi:hypothetical protein
MMAGIPGVSGIAYRLATAISGKRNIGETTMTIRFSGTAGVGAYAFAICSILALSPAIAADFPTGTFEAKQTPFTVGFDNKGQFRVTQGATLEVMGSYSATASELKLTDSKGPWACTKAGEHTGTYTWKYENAVLTLVKLTDKCAERVKSLVGLDWQQKK